MRNNSFSPLWILATGITASNEQADAAIAGFFGVTPRPVEGCYKGETERSYLVPDNGVGETRVLEFLREYKQESALLLDNQRNAFLVYSDDGRREHIGEFTEASKAIAEVQEGWTKVDGKYYICR